jgi:hypothetical protein
LLQEGVAFAEFCKLRNRIHIDRSQFGDLVFQFLHLCHCLRHRHAEHSGAGSEIRNHFELKGVPLVLTFKTGDNPFKDKKNVLTERQIKKKRRLREHYKK